MPPTATQQAIVAGIEAEQALVASNRELITRFEQKIQATLARVWGEAMPEVPLAAPHAAESSGKDIYPPSGAFPADDLGRKLRLAKHEGDRR